MGLKDRVKYTSDDVVAGAKKKRLAEGWYAFLTRDTVFGVNETSNNMFLKQTLAPLKDANDASTVSSPFASHMLTLPFSNPDVEGHEAPDTKGMATQWPQAFAPDKVPAFPKWTKNKELIYMGEVIDESLEDDIRKELTAKAYDLLLEWADDPEQLNGHRVYGKVKHKPDTDFVNVQSLSHELPMRVVLLDYKEWLK